MWVQLKSNKHIVVMGEQRTFKKGDWVDVGKFLALRWIEDGTAHIPNQEINSDYVDYTAGVVVCGKADDNTIKQITTVANHLNVAYLNDYDLPFSETLIYNAQFKKLRPELIGIGFYWLKTFEMILPMFDYKTLAVHIGTDKDKELTKEVIKELRVPVYDNRFMFVRRSEKTKQVIQSYNQYLSKISEPKLALLCAIYEHKPLFLPVPTTWLNKDR